MKQESPHNQSAHLDGEARTQLHLVKAIIALSVGMGVVCFEPWVLAVMGAESARQFWIAYRQKN